MGTSPIHVCQQNMSRTGTIMKWALKPFFVLHDVPMEFSKSEDKTIVKIETEQGMILDGVRGLASMAQKTFNLSSDIPIKVETDDKKTIITMEQTNWIFCDCDLPPTEALPIEGGGEEEKDDEEEELLERILPGVNRTTTEDESEANHDSITLINEFFEFSQAEESFLERKASIRKSLHYKKEYYGSQTLIEPTEDFLIETSSNDDVSSEKEDSKDFVDEDIRNL